MASPPILLTDSGDRTRNDIWVLLKVSVLFLGSSGRFLARLFLLLGDYVRMVCGKKNMSGTSHLDRLPTLSLTRMSGRGFRKVERNSFRTPIPTSNDLSDLNYGSTSEEV